MDSVHSVLCNHWPVNIATEEGKRLCFVSRMTHTKMILCILLLAACAGLIFVYSHFNPESNSLFPKCIFLQLTGLKCPGCGSQRVIHNLLNLNLQKAFEANAFLVLSIPYIIALLVSVPLKSRFPKFYNTLNSVPVIISIGVLVIAWWITRNIFDW